MKTTMGWGNPVSPKLSSARARFGSLVRVRETALPLSRPIDVRRASAAIIVDRGKVLLTQREASGEEPLRWQFPGGEIDTGETPKLALYRELEEELGIVDVRARAAGEIQARVGEKETRVSFFLIDGYRGTIQPREGQPLQWVAAEETDSFDLVWPNRQILLRLPSIWDGIWQSDTKHYSDVEVRDNRVREKLRQAALVGFPTTPSGICVDIGAGSFSVAHYLNRGQLNRGPAKNARANRNEFAIISIEGSTQAIRQFGSRVRGRTQILQADATELPLADSCADTVIAFNIVEHVPNHQLAIKEIRRILKPGGDLYLCHSNTRSTVYIHRIAQEMLGRWNYGFQLNMNPRKLADIIESHGFRVSSWRTDPPGKDRPILRVMDTSISRALPSWGRNVTLHAKRAEVGG